MNAITAIAPANDNPPLADSLFNFIAMAVRDPSVDVTKLSALLREQRQIIADDARLKFQRAFTEAQAEMVPVTRDAVNDQTRSKYARLETIDAAIRPIYTRYGFAMSFDSEPIEGGVRIVCEVTHRDGHAKTYRLESGLDTAGAKGNANKTPMHGLGSAVSYLRRYLKTMVWDLALANEDNDGNRQQTPPKDGKERVDGRMTPAELKILDDLMIQTKTAEGKFLAFHELDFRSIQQVPATEFPRLKNSLLAKVRVLTEREAFAAKARAAAARQPQNGARS